VAKADDQAMPGFLAGDGEMASLMRTKDWSATPLGPVETWSPSLRMMTTFLLANRFPLLLWWGPHYLSIYNDAYRPVLGNKHPEYLGRPVSECWSEIWHILKPLIDTPFNGGPATWMEDLFLEINRHGFVEEAHFTVAYSPVPDDTAAHGIGGVLATVHEITEKIVGERRMLALRDLGLRVAEGRTAEAACTIAAGILANHAKDVPFALLYLLDENGRQARLAGAAGIGMGELASPLVVGLGEDAASNLGWPLADAARGEAMITVGDLEERFAHIPRGPWSDPPHSAVIVPIRSSKVEQLAGLLVAGVSPRLQLDELYRSFFDLVATQIATAIANACAYEEERKQVEALAEIDRAKTAFFSNVSHEFRTPLTLMLGPLEDMRHETTTGAMSQVQRDRLDVAHRNGLRLLRLVNALLDFSRIEAGRTQAHYQSTDLSLLTTDLASGFRSAMEKAGLVLEIDCPPLPASVFVDRDMWEKVVLNLLSNAFKFTFDGRITVTLRAAGDHAVLTVRDTGVGIPAHELPRLFERFHRIEGQRSRSFEGSGIGLALVHELVRLHGGTIEAQSVPGQGTDFTVSVPFGKAHLPGERIDATSNQVSTATRIEAFVEEALRWLPDGDTNGSSVAASALSEISDTPRATVLVADDNADMRNYVRRLLAGQYRVETASDGQSALEAIRAGRPDLVLADVMMPRLDGFGLLRAIREDPELHELPVIMLSARAGEESRVEGLHAGADDYLVKPFSARELLACVESVLKLARLRQSAAAELQERERRLRALVEASSDVVYRMSPDWSELRHLIGRDFIADTTDPSRTWLATYIHPDDQPRIMAAIHEAIRTRSPFESEHRVRRVDGSLGWTFSRAVPMRDADGNVTEWIGTATDVTAKKRSEEALRRIQAEEERQRRLYEAILTTTPDLAYVFDLDHRFIYANEGLLAMWGKTREEALGKTCLELGYEPWHAAMHDREIDQVIATRKPVRGEVPFTGAFGRRNYDYIFTPVLRPDGSVEAVAGTTRDITEHKQIEEAIARSEAELRRLNETLEGRVAEEVAAREQAQARLIQAQRMEALGELAGGIAHDFNNIIQGVQGGAALIERRPGDTGRVVSLARMIIESADRGAAITRRLLAFSRRGDLRAEPVDAVAMLVGMQEILSHTLGSGIAVRVETEPGLPPLLADKRQLETVLVNLAANARDAMQGIGTLTLGAATDVVSDSEMVSLAVNTGRYVRMSVADTGSGMSPEVLARASEPFFTTKPTGQGTGLGLAMARGFAEQSGGRLFIHSVLGRGTVVKLWFPIAEGALLAAVKKDGPADIASRGIRARLLLVDDEEIVRETLALELETEGYSVLPAASGAEALALLDASEAVDLVISDLSMPGMDGVSVIREAQRRRARLPAILLTGFATSTAGIDLDASINGAVSLLRKPVRGKTLAEHVALLLEGKAAAMGGNRLG